MASQFESRMAVPHPEAEEERTKDEYWKIASGKAWENHQCQCDTGDCETLKVAALLEPRESSDKPGQPCRATDHSQMLGL